MVCCLIRFFLKVTFLGYFAGCVDHNNMSVVSGDGKDEDLGWRALYRPGPEPVRARVLLVDYVNKVNKRYLQLEQSRAPESRLHENMYRQPPTRLFEAFYTQYGCRPLYTESWPCFFLGMVTAVSQLDFGIIVTGQGAPTSLSHPRP